MKILHVCLAAFYIDNYSYQENMLPKYHKKLGHDVAILASLQTFDKNGNPSFLEKGSEYINEHGIPVKRIAYKKGIDFINKKLKKYDNIYEHIKNERPDIIFVHGCQFSNMKDIRRYVMDNPSTKVYVDNHCDFSNSATNWFSKNILHKILWKKSAKLIEPYVTKFYGVLPARTDFIIDMYKVDPKKVELLVMGADDEKVKEASNEIVKKSVRYKYGISDDDFLIVTGGKIDSAKKQILLLIDAVKKINKTNLKLLIFGSIAEELQEEVNKLIDGDIVRYIGWVNSEDSYKYFAAADLVVFPGRHSVFWEQCVGLGIPMVVKYWEGTTHIDIGGNCKFLYEDNAEEIINIINNIIENENIYNTMKINAQNKGMEIFSYKNIAKKSIDLRRNKWDY